MGNSMKGKSVRKTGTSINDQKDPGVGRTSSHNDYRIHTPGGISKRKVKCLYDFDAPQVSADGLSFKIGDILDVLDDSDRDWWTAYNPRTQKTGSIPYNYVTNLQGIESFDWFHANVTKSDSDKLLVENAGNIIGSYLVRKSDTLADTYTLSVLFLDDRSQRITKNYRIRTMENDSGYFITSKNIFPSISQLLDYYSKNNGLCCPLSRICPKMIPATEDLSKATRDKWEIDRRTLTKIEILGSGNFGEVWRGTWNSTRQVAIKLMKPGTMDKTTFLEEAAVMKKLRHPKLVRLYAVCSTEEPIYIVMEYIPHGCLQKYLKKDGGKKLTEPVLIDFAAQIASGMQYVESKCIIHRDLAARNVLVADNNMLKIADFGLSKSLKDNAIYVFKEGSKFPIKWTAIEAITSQNFSIKSDVWSFGILLVELVTYGNTPYPGMTAAEVQLKLQGAFRHPKPPGCSDELYEIMLQCWHANPQKRPTFDSLFHILDDFIIATQNSYE